MPIRFYRALRQNFDGWVKVVRFANHFRPLWRKAILANIYGGLSSALQLIVPLGTVVIINEVLPTRNLHLLIKVSLVMGAAAVTSIGTSYLEFFYASVFRGRISMMLELELFEHIQSQPYLFFKKEDSGYIVSRIINDSHTAVEVVVAMTGIGRSLVWVISGIVLLPFFHLALGLFVIALMPVYFFLLFWFNRRTKEAFVIVQEKTALAAQELFESLSGVYETKAYGAQKYRARRYAKALVERTRILIKARMLMIAGSQLSQVITLIVSLFVITYGGAAVIAGDFSLGALIGLNTVAAYILVPINRLVQETLKAQQALASIERIEDWNKLEGELDVSSVKSLPRAQGHIRYENISFSYEGRRSVLQDINFEIHPGEAILLMGPSGIGKTTLVNLLLRFFEPMTGAIYLDGIPIQDISLGHLRKQIAYVSQDAFLFSDSIYNNIRIGNLASTHQGISAAARLANAMEMIEQLPDKFDTQVGERGARLSGGQRQRITIARALVRDAPILIFDEATSAVDLQTEVAVHEALCKLMKDRTTIIIAHHASAFIDYVDRAFVFENGYLKEKHPYAAAAYADTDLRVSAHD